MQKPSYSTRTRGTIPTAPTVNALVIHRRLQPKDRVRAGVEDLLSGFANSQGAGHGEMKGTGKYGAVARTQARAACKWRTRGAEVSEPGSCARHVQTPRAPTHRTPMHFQQLPHSPLQLVTFPLTKPATSILKWLKRVWFAFLGLVKYGKNLCQMNPTS